VGERPSRGQGGQATIELVGALPALLLAGYVAFQLLATGYALTLADGAAEAGALALAAGRPVTAAARGSLPDWADGQARIRVRGGTVSVRIRPPAPLDVLGERLAITATAAARPR
jgi:hypothetical protein